MDARSFAQQLVGALQNHGLLEGRPALAPALEALREKVMGRPDDLAFVDELLSRAAPPSVTPQGRAGPTPSFSGPIRLLLLAANPMRTPRLRLDEEVRTIEERLREAQALARFIVQSEWAVREKDLSRILLERRPHLVHFSGHGEQGGELVLEDPSGNPRPVAPSRLAELFSILREQVPVQGVVLNACWSEAQARALVEQGGVPWVIGMERPVQDRAAIAFAAGFYRGIAFDQPIQTAFALGVHEMEGDFPEEASNPHYLPAAGVGPTTTYVEVAARAAPPASGVSRHLRPSPGPSAPPPATPAAPKPTSTPPADSATLRALLVAAFSDDELTTFCYDWFHPLYEDFASGMTKGQKIQRLMEFCEHRGETARLLAAVRQANPTQYARFFGAG